MYVLSSVLQMQPLLYAQFARRIIYWADNQSLNQSTLASLWLKGSTSSGKIDITFDNIGITEINQVKISMISRSLYYENGNQSELFK